MRTEIEKKIRELRLLGRDLTKVSEYGQRAIIEARVEIMQKWLRCHDCSPYCYDPLRSSHDDDLVIDNNRMKFHTTPDLKGI